MQRNGSSDPNTENGGSWIVEAWQLGQFGRGGFSNLCQKLRYGVVSDPVLLFKDFQNMFFFFFFF